MKVLLTAINAKYIHSNLAIYNLRAYAKPYTEHIEIAEYTINHYADDILADIYKKSPDVIALSCYIWNLNYIEELIGELKKILPDTDIWLGGPEVSYDAEKFLTEHPQVSGIMVGEGEQIFADLMRAYIDGNIDWKDILGITYRDADGSIRINAPAPCINMDTIPFVYEHLEHFTNRIIYYESSRGCPFSCSYCLSSIDKHVRFRSPELVKTELQFFLDHKVPQVKFVDRTFNCNHRHALDIWNYILEHDNGVTNFHFEIAADILNEEELTLLGKMRPGLVQLEIGVQSTNTDTIHEIDRVMDFAHVANVVRRIQKGHNIHQHLDLIAGLPHEDMESFIHSFNDVYGLHPQQLQLGFLKVLKGSKMFRNAGEYDLVYRARPQYEVLSTKWISYGELLRLKAVEEMVEVYYNSAQFRCTLECLEQEFAHPFAMYEALADYYETHDLNGKSHSRMARFDILRDFILEKAGANPEKYEDLLLTDLYLRENSKSRPSWARDLSPYKQEFYDFYKKEETERSYLPGYENYNFRQMMHMTHIEVLSDGTKLLFDYQKRDALHGDAATQKIM